MEHFPAAGNPARHITYAGLLSTLLLIFKYYYRLVPYSAAPARAAWI